MKLHKILIVLCIMFAAPALAFDPAKVKVCHYTNNKTLTIGSPALKAHLAHGDTQGSCQTNSTTNIPVMPSWILMLTALIISWFRIRKVK